MPTSVLFVMPIVCTPWSDVCVELLHCMFCQEVEEKIEKPIVDYLDGAPLDDLDGLPLKDIEYIERKVIEDLDGAPLSDDLDGMPCKYKH